MTTLRVAAAGLFLVMVTAASGIASQPTAVRAGQIVFSQFEGDFDEAGDLGVGSVTLAQCVKTPDGLSVTGRARGQSELVLVLVTGGQFEGPGRAVAAGFAEDAELVVDAGPGDFMITLPWATLTSGFAIVEPALHSANKGDLRSGQVARCPVGGPAD